MTEPGQIKKASRNLSSAVWIAVWLGMAGTLTTTSAVYDQWASEGVRLQLRAFDSTRDPLTLEASRLCGWPFLGFSFDFTRTTVRLGGVPPQTEVTAGGLDTGYLDAKGYPIAVPYRPEFPEILWSAAAWLLITSPILLVPTGYYRRFRKRRPGQCPHCAYDVRGVKSAVCPECGRCIQQSDRTLKR